jgi:hypothetical protein
MDRWLDARGEVAMLGGGIVVRLREDESSLKVGLSSRVRRNICVFRQDW